jgi:hypothetical protein
MLAHFRPQLAAMRFDDGTAEHQPSPRPLALVDTKARTGAPPGYSKCRGRYLPRTAVAARPQAARPTP